MRTNFCKELGCGRLRVYVYGAVLKVDEVFTIKGQKNPAYYGIRSKSNPILLVDIWSRVYHIMVICIP